VVDATAGFPIGGGIADLGFGIAMDFIDLLYTPLRKRVATAKFEEVKLRVAAEVLDVAWRTRTAFYGIRRMNSWWRCVARWPPLPPPSNSRSACAKTGNIRELDLASEHALAEEAKLDLRLAEVAVRESREC
jgi:hypothetical protein